MGGDGEAKKEKRGFWGKLWDNMVVKPIKAIANAIISPPAKKGCICRIFDFLTDVLGYVLLLMIDLFVLLWILYIVFLGIGAAISVIPGAQVPAAIDWIVSTLAVIIVSLWWLYIFIAIAILWGISAFIAKCLC